MYILKLERLVCLSTQEAVDEPYLTGWVDRESHKHTIWGPESMDKGDSKNLDKDLTFEDKAYLELWEDDGQDGDELIGSIIIYARPTNDTQSRSFYNDHEIGGTLHYKLYYSVKEIPDPYTLRLKTLKCLDPQETVTGDEVYIMIDGRRVWGENNMKKGESLPVNFSHNFTDSAQVQLWEDDDFIDDLFGTKTVRPGSNGTMTFKKDRGIVGDAHYTLTYSVDG